ncbi:MAG TPA: type VI secretion system membrane subunit TssM, partial [Gammaproteobacteria bacterium]|nr:type VI secretion system membrane subunit TssM [Gammaproteobacteria bacterium]
MWRRIVRWLAKPWLWLLIGVVAVSLVIWFVGPLVAVAGYRPLDTAVSRLLAIMSIVVAWGLNNLRARIADSKADRRLSEALVTDAARGETGESPADDAEQGILANRLRDALRTLRASGLTRRGRLYSLPWYMVIGAPGSGKSTMIRASGLHFPLQDRIGDNPVPGEGSTRYCDWWFAEEAVLIDTAGRYTTQQDPGGAASEAWLSFLGLLRRRRPKRPLNGIIVTASLLDLVDRTPGELERQRTAVKRRIEELNRHLSMRLPVYFVFTKCDLVAGFTDYFADLEGEDRQRPWGVTLPLRAAGRPDAGSPTLGERFAAMVSRAATRLLGRLHQERDPRRRRLLYGFPRQMMGLRQDIEGFLDAVFAPSRFQPDFLLRGVYFVSGTQTPAVSTESPVGAVPGRYRSPVVSAAGAAGPKSYFVAGLFSRIIFPESGLASANTRSARRHRLGYVAAVAGLVMTFCVGLGLWHWSYRANTSFLAAVDSGIDAYRNATGGGLEDPAVDWGTLAAGLSRLREFPRGYEQGHADPSWRMTLGLYQGGKVGVRAADTYRRALARFLIPKVAGMLAGRVETELGAPAGEGRLYEALRCYLMLYKPKHMAREAFLGWVETLWRRRVPGRRSRPVRRALTRHLKAALAGGVDLPEP